MLRGSSFDSPEKGLTSETGHPSCGEADIVHLWFQILSFSENEYNCLGNGFTIRKLVSRFSDVSFACQVDDLLT